ncbi:MAG: Deoxycytidine triphosphate deaminase, partial [uncultured Thermomicrobiales bacterium]
GARARHDRAVRGAAGPRRRHLVRRELVRLRHARGDRVPDLHERAQLDRRPQELRPEVVRRVRGRRVHRAAQLVRARALGGVLPHPARRGHDHRREVDLRAVRDHHERHALRAGVGGLRDARDLEHHAAPGEDLRERGDRAGAVLQGRRAAGGLVQGQGRQVSGAARGDAATVV